MKQFIFTIAESKWSRASGSSKVTANIYQIKKNKPEQVGSVEWNTGSFKGETSAVMNKLAELGKIPKTYKENRG